MVKGEYETEAWADGTRVCLRVPQVGFSRVLWVDLYEGPKVDDGNFASVEVEIATTTAMRAAAKLAKRWRSMTFDAARAEYEAL